MRSLKRTTAALAAALLCCSLAGAQPTDTEARLRAQLRDTTLQLRQSQDENAALRARAQQLEQVKPAAPPARPEADTALRRALGERDARIAELMQQLTLARQQAQEAAQKPAELLRQREDELAGLRAQAQERQAAYEHLAAQGRACEDNNAQLVVISGELLKAYEDKGVWSALKDAEPLTRIHRVKLETLAQDYHIKIRDRTLKPPAPPPGK
jgi:hypothetical protein